MLAFVDMIHALPTRGRKVANSFKRGIFASRGRKMWRNSFVQAELTFLLWELFVTRFALCFPLLPTVSSPFASP
jgi:hypothetical protein